MRFAGMPDILELDHLTVSGDVTFGKKVSLKVPFQIMQFCCVRITLVLLVQLSSKDEFSHLSSFS